MVQRLKRAVFFFVQALYRAVGGVQQGLRVGQAAVFGVELDPFVSAGGQLLQFTDLPGQALTLGLQRGLRLLRLCQCGLRLAPGLPESAQRCRVQAGVGVQQATHGVGPGQALPGVLAVDVQQLLAQLAQLGGGGGAAIDPGPALALGVHGAAQQQATIGVKPGFVQPGVNGGAGVKFGAHVGAAGAFPHGAHIGAAACDQLQRIDQDRLARAGFAGQHTKAAGQLKLELAHNHKVTKGQALEAHGQTAPSFQCSFCLRVSK